MLLGKRMIKVEPLGLAAKPEVPQIARGDLSPYGKMRKTIADDRSLPAGALSKAKWHALLPMLDLSHLNDSGSYYKDQLIARPQVAKKQEAPAAKPLVRPNLSDIPPIYQTRTMVELRQYDEEAGTFGTVSVPANVALRETRKDINILELLKKCIGG